MSLLCPFSNPVSPSPPPGRIQGRKLIGHNQEREPKTPLSEDAASRQCPRTLGGSMVRGPRNCSSSGGIPRAQVFRFLWSLSAIRPRPPAPEKRAIYNLWFSDHPSPPPFLRPHSFAPKTQRPCLNLKREAPQLFKEQRGKASERLGPSPQPGPDPSPECSSTAVPSRTGGVVGAPGPLPGTQPLGSCLE